MRIFNTSGACVPEEHYTICQHLVDVVVKDRSQLVTMDAFYFTLKYFLTERFDKNILNIIQKAREKKDFMVKLLFGETAVPFTVNDPDIAYLYANGVVDNVDGYVQTAVPLYSKALIVALRPLINGETQEYVSAYDNFSSSLMKSSTANASAPI